MADMELHALQAHGRVVHFLVHALAPSVRAKIIRILGMATAATALLLLLVHIHVSHQVTTVGPVGGSSKITAHACMFADPLGGTDNGQATCIPTLLAQDNRTLWDQDVLVVRVAPPASSPLLQLANSVRSNLEDAGVVMGPAWAAQLYFYEGAQSFAFAGEKL